MTKKITKIEQMEYDIGYAYQCLDEVLAIAQLLQKYIKSDEPLNKWMMGKSIDGLTTLITDIQCNLEICVERK